MELGRETVESVQRIERKVHNKASLGHTKLRQRNESRGRCIRFCDRRSVINEV